MVEQVDAWLSHKSPRQIAAIGLVLVALIGVLDYLTGYELSFSIFYLVPIVVVTWYAVQGMAYFLCVVSAVTWCAIDLGSGHSYGYWFIPIWNAAARLGFFLITSHLLSRLKMQLALEVTFARTDGLTRILNARAFRDIASHLLPLARRHHHSSALGYIDLDNFKTVNDRAGHAEGDRVLQAVASTLAKCVRDSDIVARLGGDEFAVFLPEANSSDAKVVFTKLHAELMQIATAHNWPIGYSIGVAVFSHAPSTIDQALGFADRLMYRVKKGGKNDVVYEEVADLDAPPVAAASLPPH